MTIPPLPEEAGWNRRKFLTTSAAALLASGSLPAWAADAPRRTPVKVADGKKIRIAFVGLGGAGRQQLERFTQTGKVTPVAFCDVDWRTDIGSRAPANVVKDFPDVPRYFDFRKMLLERDSEIDAVTIATPDHMHFLPAYMAMLMGKHVYVEKPMTQTIWEARELLTLARKTGVCTQMNNLGHSFEGVRRLKEWVQAGVIGAVKEVHVWTNRPSWPQGMNFLAQEEPVPKGLEWDLYIGRSQPYAYNTKAYHHYLWRGWRNFGSGALGDMGCHTMDGPFFALDLDAPLSVEADAMKPTEYCFPLGAEVKYEFAARGDRGPVTVKWFEGASRPPRWEELGALGKISDSGLLFIGEKGKIFDSSDKVTSPRLIPDDKMRELNQNPVAQTLPRIPDQDHFGNFLEAIYKGDPSIACSNFEYATPLTEFVLLGNLAIFSKGPLDWDAKAMKTNNNKANELLKPTFRAGWSPEDIAKLIPA